MTSRFRIVRCASCGGETRRLRRCSEARCNDCTTRGMTASENAKWYREHRKDSPAWREENKRRAKAWREKNAARIKQYNEEVRPSL